MTGFDLDAGDAVLQAGVGDGLWPGLVAAVGTGDTTQREWVLGSAENWPGGHRAMTADTVFDVASLTKVLATLPAVLLLVQGGRLGLDDVAAQYVPGVDGRVRVRHLLTHTSGLPAHRHFHDVTSLAGIVARAAAEPLEVAPDTRVTYSDLGFLLLGAIVQAVSGDELPAFAAREVFTPLAMTDATYDPPHEWLPRIAATEVMDGVLTHGVVHDENARAAGGHTGHAGLFATLADVRAAVPLWLPGGPLLDDGLRDDALRDHTAGLGGDRGLGWTCRGDGYDILSDGWGAAVSHTGFTGTSLAIDPATARWAVLLTNHVHYGRGRPEVFAARRRFHAALVGD